MVPEDKQAPDEEPSEGTLEAGEELEAALREASEALEVRQRAEAGEGGNAAAEAAAPSADKMTIEAFSDELRSLKERYESLVAEYDAAQERSLRLQAEFENYRRRGLKERQEALQYGHQNLVKDLLSVVDNLERAVEHSEDSGDRDLQSILQGVELVLRELLGVLGKHGVKAIEADGEAFDPTVHEAMSQLPDGSVPPNTVVQVLQKGYQLRDRMLRPARVIVSREPDDGAAAGGEEAESDSEH